METDTEQTTARPQVPGRRTGLASPVAEKPVAEKIGDGADRRLPERMSGRVQ